MKDDFSVAMCAFLIFIVTLFTIFILYFTDIRTELILETIQQTQTCIEIEKGK